MSSSQKQMKAMNLSMHCIAVRLVCLQLNLQLQQINGKSSAWFPQVKVRTLTPDEVKAFDPSGLCFWNLNTPEEFIRSRETR